MRKFTAGPWYAGTQNDGLFILNQPPRPSNDDINPAGPKGLVVIAKVYDEFLGAVRMANANLIAAAPEMLTALKAAEPLMTALCSVALKPEIDDYLPSGLKEQITDWLRKNLDGKAIAKAEGKAV